MRQFLALFPAFKYKNFQLFILGQFITVSGTWMQQVAQAWLVLTLTHSAFLVGVIAAARNLPTLLLFGLFGGAIVDRFKKKKTILYLTKICAMFLALILSLLTFTDVITLTQIAILAFLLGVVDAIDNPARQVFVAEMVEKQDLSSAIAINAGVFNAARMIGPSIAGFLIFLIEPAGVFMINAVGYLAVIFALIFIKEKEVVSSIEGNPLKSIKVGLSYSFSHPMIKSLLIFGALTSIFGWSYSTILPVVVRDVFRLGAVELGYMYSAFGIGSVVATILVSIFANRVNKIAYIIAGSLLFSLSMITFSYSSEFNLSLVLLFLAGVGIISQFAMMNTAIQHIVPDNIRGRVMSIYVFMLIGMLPIGSFQIGFLAEHLGSLTAIRIGAIVVLLFGILWSRSFLKDHKVVNF